MNEATNSISTEEIGELWRRFSEWVHCICIVTFDLELGQAMEAIYPEHIEFSEQEKLNICYLAFPDSNSGCMGDTQFHIRLRVKDEIKNTQLNPDLQRFNLQCVTTQRADSSHYWGYVYFRQIKDTTISRGYFQKSVVLLSRLPFTNLFYEITSLIAPKYFENGGSVLKAACREINNWPKLQAGECAQLPLLGSVYQTYLPSLTSANLQHLQQQQHRILIEREEAKTASSPSTLSQTESLLRSPQNVKSNIQETSFTSTSQQEILDRYKQSKQTLLANPESNELFVCDNKNDSNDNIFDEIENSTKIYETNGENKDLSHEKEGDIDDDDDDDDEDDEVIDIGNCAEYSNNIEIRTNEKNVNDSHNDQMKSMESTVWTAPFELSTKTPIVLSSVHEIDIFRSLYSIISYTHLLWELVLTAEPIVVMATSPSDCSHMVQSLMSLISPLPYCAEARPYFTIHDSEFKEFTQRQQGPPSIILGVTNPFFSKTLKHWPHLIRLPDSNNGSNTASLKPQQLRKLKIFTKLSDSAPGVYTQYKPFLQKDKTFLKNLIAGVKKQRPAEVQSALLRRHLLELTQSFMIPLERYMASLMPLQRDISAFKAAPAPNHFKPDCFLATLEQSGPQLTSPLKGDWCGLYKRFFRSPNFRDWYEYRYRELTQTLQHLQMQALSNANLKKWVEGKREVEIVDMILRVKQKLKICNEMPMDFLPQAIVVQNQNTRQQLLRHLDDMKRYLPEDLNKILSNS